MSHNYQQPGNPSLYGGGGGPGSGANYYDPNADFSAAISQARHQRRYEKGSRPTPPSHHDEDDDGEDSDPEDTSFFSKAIGFLSEHKEKLGREDVDEEKVVNAHQTLYGGSGSGSDGSGKKHDAEFLGGGAAMQALKMFMDSQSGSEEKKGNGGNDQNKLIGMAMAQAGKLWEKDNKEGRAATDKQSAVNAAAKYALQMYLKGGNGGSTGTGGLGGLAGKLLSGSGGGGSSSGGGSNLLGFAKKFL